MTDLEFKFLSKASLTPELQDESDRLDRLAFAGSGTEMVPEFAGIRWAAPDWMGLGFLRDALVTQVFLPVREICVGGQTLRVAGVGGMATHPDHQHQGYGSVLLKATEDFMRAELQVPFGLLICADATRPFYERAGWQAVADALTHEQDGRRQVLKTCVMVLPLTSREWLSGEIDLCGLPW